MTPPSFYMSLMALLLLLVGSAVGAAQVRRDADGAPQFDAGLVSPSGDAHAMLEERQGSAPTRSPAPQWSPREDELYELVFMSSRNHSGKLIAGAFVLSFAEARANVEFAPLFARLAPGPRYVLESSYGGKTLGALLAMTGRYLLGHNAASPHHRTLAFFGAPPRRAAPHT